MRTTLKPTTYIDAYIQVTLLKMVTSEEYQRSKHGENRSAKMKKHVSLMCEVCGDGPFAKPYNIRRHALTHKKKGLGWHCPVCQHPFKQGRQLDMINHMRKLHRQHPWLHNNTLIPTAKEVTYSHQQKPHSVETFRERSKSTTANGLWVTPEPSDLDMNSTNVVMISVAEYKLFKEWRAMVNSMQADTFTLSDIQPISREETTSNVMTEEDRSVSSSQLLNVSNPKKSTDEEELTLNKEEVTQLRKHCNKSVDYKYEVEYILDRRTVCHGTTKIHEVLIKWLNCPEQYNSWVQERDLVDINHVPT